MATACTPASASASEGAAGRVPRAWCAVPPSVPITDGGPTVLLEHRPEQMGRGRLAVGAGDPHGPKRRGGVVEEGARGERHGWAGPTCAEDQLDRACGFACQLALAHKRDRARRRARGREFMPVDVVSWQAAMQRLPDVRRDGHRSPR